MPKDLLNEAEQYLVKNWSDARRLEEAMDEVRDKYKEVFERVAEVVTAAHPELDVTKAYVTQFWGKGSIGFSRREWPDSDGAWPPGLWMDELRLEKLASESEPPPGLSIWLMAKTAKKVNMDLADARLRLRESANELLTPAELTRLESDSSEEALLSFASPSKKELLELLVDGDGQGFVDAVASQFELMARFVPTLDKLFSGKVA